MATPLEDRLRTELRDEATGVEPRAGYVTSAVGDVLVRRRHRQHRFVAAVVAVAALGAGGVIAGTQSRDSAIPPTIDKPTPTPPAPTQSPPDLALADMQQPSARQVAWDSLPWHDTALPRVLPSDVETAPTLSQDPVDRALALVAGPGTDVGVVGDDGRLRRLDGVDLERPRDRAGYGSSPVEKGSLTPDGRLAAFPQPHGVVVLDIASGSSQWFDVPGFNERVSWHPDRRHMLVGGQDAPNSLLDTADGSVDAVPYAASRTAFSPDGTPLEVRAAARSLWHWQGSLLRWTDDEPERLPISTACCTETPPSATGDLLVMAGSTEDVDPDAPVSEDGWIVLDLDTGRPISMLRAPVTWYGTWTFGLHGWLGDDAVLIQTYEGVLVWTPSTGAIERITQVTTDTSFARDALD